jgi:Dolichyl-phosphate-mannose-protein mannosyltransferase
VGKTTTGRSGFVATGVAGLLAVLALQLTLYARYESQTWDEGDHIYSGYMSWNHGDFGLNPEHPPLVKMLATAALFGMPLHVPTPQGRFFKYDAFLGGKDFLYRNDADAILLRSRLAAASLSVLLALLAFLAGREMFGTGAGFVALALLAFDPNILAHGPVVTTDTGLTCFMLATVYAFYRYVKAPSAWRLTVVGVAAGLALAAKHTGLLVLPILAMLAVVEVALNSRSRPAAEGGRGGRFGPGALRMAGRLIVVCAIAVAILWAFYGFRYDARPAGLALNPPLAEFVKQAPKPLERSVVEAAARWRLLPESYLYGLADVLFMDSIYTSFLLGKVYPHGVWFYFPAAFAIKSTLPFLALPFVIAAAVVAGRLRGAREVLFLAIPPVFHLLVAMSSRMNIGVRHILPLYAFLAVLGGGALAALARESRPWRIAAVVLVLFQAVSSVRSYPAYIAYANELWGGPSKTHLYLTDSNSDWGQQLRSLKAYLDGRGVKTCWFAYFGEGVADTAHYGIPCKPLPTADSLWIGERIDAPPAIDGTVVISAGVLSGFEFGPGPLNPYAQFQALQPTAEIDGGLFVFDGRFEIPFASALTHVQRAEERLAAKDLDNALVEAQQAVALAPDAVKPNAVLGDVLTAMGRRDEAQPAYEKAIHLAKTVKPEFQGYWADILSPKLAAR